MTFETENGTDGADALSKACSALQKFQWDHTDLNFTFNQIEIKMQQHGVKKQFTKLQTLSTVLPKIVIDEIKHFLGRKEDEFPENNAYLITKQEILRIFGQSEDAQFERAMQRVLVGKPSQLARGLVGDLCTKRLKDCCCHRFIGGLWRRQLPAGVRQVIADTPFNADNFDKVLQTADNVYASTRPTQNQVSVAAISGPEVSKAHDSAFHPSWSGPPEDGQEQQIAAYNVQRGGGQRGGRGQGRGGRGGRGYRGNRGNRGGSGNGRGGQGNQGQGEHPRHKTKRHADSTPYESCFRHWTYGKSANFCMEPGSCPWKDFWVPKANN